MKLLVSLLWICSLGYSQPTITPNDTFYQAEAYLKATQINAPAAWYITTGSPGIVIALVGGGVFSIHPDLTGNLIQGFNITDNNTNTNEVTGVSPGAGNWVGHGTWAAGVIAPTTNNGFGASGVCWLCKIMPVKVIADNGLTASDASIVAGITWAMNNGAKIINLDYPVSTSAAVSAAAQSAFNAGVLVVAPVGNNGTVSGMAIQPAANPGVLISVPDNPYIITVSGTSSFSPYLIDSISNIGDLVDVSAPDFSNYTTQNGGGYGADSSGTGIASAIVAGVAGLVWSENPSLTVTQVRNILQQTAVQRSGAQGTRNPIYGFGSVNAYAAVLAAVSSPQPASITSTGGTPQSANVNSAFAVPLSAIVKDSGSNPVSNSTVTFTAPVSGASGVFASGVNTASTNASGVATSVIFTANSTAGGPYNVVATVSGVATGANFALTNISIVPPGAPILISAIPVSGTQVNLTWSAGGGGTPATYIVTRIPVVSATGTWTTTFSDTGSSMTTQYIYSVQACNSAGCSASSNSITTVP